jgi:hypothetical protein
MRDLFRVDPPAGPEAFKTYQIVAPLGDALPQGDLPRGAVRGLAYGFRSSST